MIYFKLPSIETMIADRDKYNLTEYMIVNNSPAQYQVCRGQYLNFYSQGCTGYPYMFAGLPIKWVSLLTYTKWLIKCLMSGLRGRGFYVKP